MENQVYNYFLKKYKYVYEEVMALRKEFSNDSKCLRDILESDNIMDKCFDNYSHWFTSENDFPFDKNVYQMSIEAGELNNDKKLWFDEIHEISNLLCSFKSDTLFGQCRDILWFIIDIHLMIAKMKYGKMTRGLELLLIPDVKIFVESVRKIVLHFIDTASSLKIGKIEKTNCKNWFQLVRRSQNNSHLEGLGELKGVCGSVKRIPPFSKASQDFAKLFKSYKILNMCVTMVKMSLDGQNECVKNFVQVFCENSKPTSSIPIIMYEIIFILNQYHEFVKEHIFDDYHRHKFWKKYEETMGSLRDILGDTIRKVFKKQVDITDAEEIDNLPHAAMSGYFSVNECMSFISANLASDCLLSKAVNLMQFYRFDKISKLYISVIEYDSPEYSFYNSLVNRLHKLKKSAVETSVMNSPESESTSVPNRDSYEIHERYLPVYYNDPSSYNTPFIDTPNFSRFSKGFVYTYNPAPTTLFTENSSKSPFLSKDSCEGCPSECKIANSSSTNTTEHSESKRLKPFSAKRISCIKIKPFRSGSFTTVPTTTVSVNEPVLIDTNEITEVSRMRSNFRRALKMLKDPDYLKSFKMDSISKTLNDCYMELNTVKKESKNVVNSTEVVFKTGLDNKVPPASRNILTPSQLKKFSPPELYKRTLPNEKLVKMSKKNKTKDEKFSDSLSSAAAFSLDSNSKVNNSAFSSRIQSRSRPEKKLTLFSNAFNGSKVNKSSATSCNENTSDISEELGRFTPSFSNDSEYFNEVMKEYQNKPNFCDKSFQNFDSSNECCLNLGHPGVPTNLPSKSNLSALEQAFIDALVIEEDTSNTCWSETPSDSIQVCKLKHESKNIDNVTHPIKELNDEYKHRFSSFSCTLLPHENKELINLLVNKNHEQSKAKIYHDDEISKSANPISCREGENKEHLPSLHSDDESSSDDSFVKISLSDIEDFAEI